MALHPSLSDDALLERLRERASAENCENVEERSERGWLCAFKLFASVPAELAPRGAARRSAEGVDLRQTREALLYQVEEVG